MASWWHARRRARTTPRVQGGPRPWVVRWSASVDELWLARRDAPRIRWPTDVLGRLSDVPRGSADACVMGLSEALGVILARELEIDVRVHGVLLGMTVSGPKARTMGGVGVLDHVGVVVVTSFFRRFLPIS